MSSKPITNQNQQRAINPVAEFRRILEGSMRAEVAKQLPKGVDPDRFIRTTITTVQMNPDLLEADRSSLFASCMQAAKDGLLPDGREATIQIYNTKVKKGGLEVWVKMAQYMLMVRGLIKKMYEAGCTKIDGVAVYEKDHFVYELGDEPKIEHRTYMGIEEPGPVIAAYAIVKLENGEIKREVMPRRDIEKVREASKSSKGPGWTTWYDQFAIKAVLKRIYKQVPGRSDEFESVIQADNAALGIDFDDPNDIPAEKRLVDKLAPAATGASQRLVGKIKAKVQETDLAPEANALEAERAIVEGESMSIADTDGVITTETASTVVNEDDFVPVEDIPGLTKASNMKNTNSPLSESSKQWVGDLEKAEEKDTHDK